MAKTPKYRLQPILDEKENKKQEAARFLNKKKEELALEEQKLEQAKLEHARAIQKKEEMVREYNENMFAGKYTIEQIKIRKLHIEDQQRRIEELRQAVERQKKAVERAELEVKKAEEALINASKEVQVMQKHKENWQRAVQEEALKKEAKQLEEIAQSMYTAAMMNRKE
ncbi:MAG: hypothetical protein RMM17_04285 [Acidobacteriota bacterium]|nr:hypothetical protein [Blastocatellia bacterium]MDW8411880.1 hypothetical protein [Acidobacteriota bacterium]